MRTLVATEVETHLGKLLEAARSEPVRVTEKGRSLVVMSEEDFKEYEAYEDAYWLGRAEEAQARDEYLGPEESMKAIRELLDRADA